MNAIGLLMKKHALSPPNAIVFVLDQNASGIQVPLYENGRLVSATGTCVSIGTQAEVDGDTEFSIEVVNAIPDALIAVFDGFISAPSRRLSIVTSEVETIAEVDVEADLVQVSVCVDDLQSPGQVAVYCLRRST